MTLPILRYLRAWALCLAGCWLVAGLQAAPTVQLDDRRPQIDPWPSITLLADPGQTLTLDQVRARRPDFQPPDTPASNLGLRTDAVWLHLALRVHAGDGLWLLDIDYPVLNQADVYLVQDGRLLLQRRLGSNQAFTDRPLSSRTHALPLTLAAGQTYELYLRVLTQGAMVLPISLSKPNTYHAREAGRQLAQGGMMGVALALLAYSVAHGLSLRSGLFALYALMLLGTTLFFMDFFGITQQYLWSGHSGLAAKGRPLAVLLAAAAGAQFVARALAVRSDSPRMHAALTALTALAVLGFVLSVVGVLDYRASQSFALAIGPLLPVLAIPMALRRARDGDDAAVYMLLGWSGYLIGAIVMILLLTGQVAANFLTLHIFQWGTLLEMLAWVRVLALHVGAVRHSAERTELERQALVSLAHTDALTGLPNRRGLSLALDAALPQSRSDSALVVYLLDLDGFKPINDRYGHDVGDALLVQVGQRLRRQLRRDDVVARLGGDEFVIMTAGISGEAEALALGRKLLDAFLQPFEADGQHCRVGLTIGFALAPHDGRSADDLLKRADAAMYAGKQTGRHCVNRGGASLGLAGGV